MIKPRQAGQSALVVARFLGTSSHELAFVVHRETEIKRAAQAARLHVEHGEFMPHQNLLAIPVRPVDWCSYVQWTEYLTDEVIARAALALKISKGALLGRIVSELRPDDWETLFWRGSWHQLVEESSSEIVELEMQLEEQAEKFKAQKLTNAKAGGDASHDIQYGIAKAFVRSEWATHKNLHDGNKSAFARKYVEKVRSECDRVVTHKTIASSWLKGY